MLRYPSADGTEGDNRTISALEALGLRIEQTKGPAEYIAIESVQKLRPNDLAVIVRS